MGLRNLRRQSLTVLRDFKHHIVQAWEGSFNLQANSNLIVLSWKKFLSLRFKEVGGERHEPYYCWPWAQDRRVGPSALPSVSFRTFSVVVFQGLVSCQVSPYFFRQLCLLSHFLYFELKFYFLSLTTTWHNDKSSSILTWQCLNYSGPFSCPSWG